MQNMHKQMSDYSFVEISSSALRHNWQVFRNLLPTNIKMAAVIKANAYGHDQLLVQTILEDLVDFWQVDSLRELQLVRQTSNKPALLLGFVPSEQLAQAVDLQGTLALYDLEKLRQLDAIGQQKNTIVPVHIKIDALFGRQGLLIEQLPEFLTVAKKTSSSSHHRLLCALRRSG